MSQRFRLGIVLRLREMAEEAARIDLSHAIAAHQACVDALSAAQTRVVDEMTFLSHLQRGGAVAGDMLAATRAITAAEAIVAAAQQRLARASDALFEARSKLAEARRRREVVERLRDRFLAAERREADRRDAALMSEIASTQHALRAGGGR